MSKLETGRIRLRLWSEDDAPVLFRYASEPEIGRRAGWPPHQSVADSLEVIRTEFNNNRTWAIVLNETGEIIGCIGYMVKGDSNIEIAEDEAEIGYWVAKPYWNKGICTEALVLVCEYCFREKGFRTLWCTYFIDNPASGHVMEKCGFKDTGKTQYCDFLYGGKERPVRIMRLDSGDRNK